MRGYRNSLISVPATCLLGTWHPALRQQEPGQGHGMERENLIGNAKGDGESGTPASQEYRCPSIRGGCTRKSVETPVMGVEQRGAERRTGLRTTQDGNDAQRRGKAFAIAKQLVWLSYQNVKANKGSAGYDGQSIEDFDVHRDRNLYKIWNRLASGSYHPPPVLKQPIPKANGSVRTLGIPTVADRIAQGAVKLYLEPVLEKQFHPDSYGYRPGKSAHDALDVTRQRCWRHDWVVEVDVKGFFDNVRQDLILRALEHLRCPKWVRLYCERWLKAPMIDQDGTVEARDLGTPQGGVISPLLANLFLHYGFDRWMQRTHRHIQFCRYADDLLAHCDSERQAVEWIACLKGRMVEIGLELNPDKTRIVYVGRGKPAGVALEFTFLGYDFRERTLRRRDGVLFRQVEPGASRQAMKMMTQEIKSWRIHRSQCSLQRLAHRHNATLRGWINYYGRYWYREFSYRLWSVFQSRLVKWVRCKFRLGHRQARSRLDRIRVHNPTLFAHWALLQGGT